jgi:hypothetical protein
LALVLLFLLAATTMRSLSILTIVVTLGIGPIGVSLCRVLCPGEDVGQECHETVAPVIAADCCDGPAMSTTAVAGSESRPQDLSSAPNVSAFQRPSEAPANSGRLTRNQPHGLQANSLATVLRI